MAGKKKRDVRDKYSDMMNLCRHSDPIKVDDLKTAAFGIVMLYFTENDFEAMRKEFFEEELPRREEFRKKYCR